MRKLIFFISFLISAGQAYSQDTLQQKLNKARQALHNVADASKKITPPRKIRQDLKTVDKQIAPVKSNLNKKTTGTKTLTGYSALLKASEAKLAAYRKALQRSGVG
ncbi:MAG TPA: hypothetical protein VGM63_23430 [Mucilaginibacter sp.]